MELQAFKRRIKYGVGSSGIMEKIVLFFNRFYFVIIVAGLKDISTVWTNIKEVDLKPIRIQPRTLSELRW
jgi:hypothetical protein